MQKFGQCCEDLRHALNFPPESLFRVESNGVLYLSVGYANTVDGPGWFDQAVLFCPFCGTALQSREEIRRRAGA